jgi:putative transposase
MVNYEKETIPGDKDRLHSSPAGSWEICQRHCEGTWDNWKAKYGGMEVSDVRKMKELEDENARLKRIVANLTLENDAIKHVIEKKFGGLTTSGKR